MTSNILADIEAALLHWQRNAKRSQRANYLASGKLSRRHYWLGIPAAAMAAVVGTSVFVSVGSDVDLKWKVASGLLSIAAAVLASLQTFLAPGEKAAKHRAAAAEYGAIRREIEEYLIFIDCPHVPHREFLSSIREKMDLLARDTPQVPDDVWDTIHEEMPALPFSHYYPKTAVVESTNQTPETANETDLAPDT